MEPRSDIIKELVTMVLASAKYRRLSPDLVRTIGAKELAKGRSLKDAVKATKNKLHQVAGMYLPGATHYGAWLAQLTSAFQSGDEEQIRSVCRQIMAAHTSTRERLPILDQFYGATLAGLGPIARVLDLACGLNPLSLCWIPLADHATYFAYDIYTDMMDFLNGFFAEFSAFARAQGNRRFSGAGAVLDIIQATPDQHADVAFILKALPCLEQIDKSAGRRLLESVHADHILVSFPARSVGGKAKGMVENYEAGFYALVEDAGWSITRFEFATELVFRISK